MRNPRASLYGWEVNRLPSSSSPRASYGGLSFPPSLVRYSGIRADDDLHAPPASFVRAIGRVLHIRLQQKKARVRTTPCRGAAQTRNPLQGSQLRRRPRHSPWQVLAFEKATWGDVGLPCQTRVKRTLSEWHQGKTFPTLKGKGFEPSTPSSKGGELATCPTPSCCLLLQEIFYLK